MRIIFTANAKNKIENGENENGLGTESMAEENSTGDREVCNDTELKKLAELIKECWRKLIPKLGLTSENLKSFEETKTEEAGKYLLF